MRKKNSTLWPLPMGTNLAKLDLQVTLMLPTKFQVNWPFGLGEETPKKLFKMAAILDLRLE